MVQLDEFLAGYDENDNAWWTLEPGEMQNLFEQAVERWRSELAASAEERVDHPRHYNLHPSGVECIDIIEHLGFNVGSAIKYLWRAGLKTEDPTEDLEKAAWYCRREVERRKRFPSC